MIVSISRSSPALSAPASISPLRCFVRASFKGPVRRRLPTWSARKGGVVRWVIFISMWSSSVVRGERQRDPYSAVYREGTAYGSPLSRGRPHQSLPPDLVRQLDDHPQLCPLLFFSQHIAFLGGGKSALRRQAELIERDIFCGFIDAPLDVVLRLKTSA